MDWIVKAFLIALGASLAVIAGTNGLVAILFAFMLLVWFVKDDIDRQSGRK